MMVSINCLFPERDLKEIDNMSFTYDACLVFFSCTGLFESGTMCAFYTSEEQVRGGLHHFQEEKNRNGSLRLFEFCLDRESAKKK